MPTATMLQTSGAYEYYTPAPIIEAARETLFDYIELDPASSAKANEIVQADDYYTEEQNGLTRPWCGHIWLNHPFGKFEAPCTANCDKEHEHHSNIHYGNAAWIDKFLAEWNVGNITAACSITYAATSEKWFRPLLHLPQCFLTPRTNYLLPDGSVKKGVQKGSVVTYLGDDVERFRRAFKALGVVKV